MHHLFKICLEWLAGKKRKKVGMVEVLVPNCTSTRNKHITASHCIG